jgi:hypothetical protein
MNAQQPQTRDLDLWFVNKDTDGAVTGTKQHRARKQRRQPGPRPTSVPVRRAR